LKCTRLTHMDNIAFFDDNYTFFTIRL